MREAKFSNVTQIISLYESKIQIFDSEAIDIGKDTQSGSCVLAINSDYEIFNSTFENIVGLKGGCISIKCELDHVCTGII